MDIKQTMQWAQAIERIEEDALFCLSVAPETQDKADVTADLELIDPLVHRLVSVLRGERPRRTEWLRLAATMSAFKSAVRLALELPGIDVPDIWSRSDPLLMHLEDATFDLWLRAEQQDLDRSVSIRTKLHDLPSLFKELGIDETPAARGLIDRDLRARVWAKSGGRCWYCGIQTNPFAEFRVDHVVPVALGGAEDIGNLVPACHPCNAEKSASTVEQFRNRRGGALFWFEIIRGQAQ